MSTGPIEPQQTQASQQQVAAEPKPQTFTQEELDRIVGERVKRERDKFADYAELKARADGAKSVEQKLAELEAQNARMQRDTLASRIAAKFGVAPEDADLFLTVSDVETLTAQAKRLSEREADRKKAGPVVPGEGTTPKNSGTSDMREFTRNLFKNKE